MCVSFMYRVYMTCLTDYIQLYKWLDLLKVHFDVYQSLLNLSRWIPNGRKPYHILLNQIICSMPESDCNYLLSKLIVLVVIIHPYVYES